MLTSSVLTGSVLTGSACVAHETGAGQHLLVGAVADLGDAPDILEAAADDAVDTLGAAPARLHVGHAVALHARKAQRPLLHDLPLLCGGNHLRPVHDARGTRNKGRDGA